MRYLLDTAICIYLIKHRPKKVFKKFSQYSPSDVAISTITLFELEYGVEKSSQGQRAKKALSQFFDAVEYS